MYIKKFFRTSYISIIVLVFIPFLVLAAEKHDLVSQKVSRANFTINPLEEYLIINAELLDKPEGLKVSENILKEMFITYKKHGYAYLKITNLAENTSFTKMLFEYVKTGKREFEFKPNTGLVTDAMVLPVDGQIEIELVITHTDNESNYETVKSIVGLFSSHINPTITVAIDLLLGGIQKLDKEAIKQTLKETMDTIQVERTEKIVFMDIRKQNKPLIELFFQKRIGYLERTEGNIPELFRTQLFKSNEFNEESKWRQRAIEISRSVVAEKNPAGIIRLIDFYSMFSDHLDQLPLTKLDRQMYLAAAICDWSKDMVEYGFDYQGKKKKFKMEHYGQIRNNLVKHLNDPKIKDWMPCNFSFTQKLPPERIALYDFLLSSKTDFEDWKKATAEDYIKNQFILQIGIDKIPISKKDYIDFFRVIKNAKFTAGDGRYHDGKMLYPFEFADLGIRYKGKTYKNTPIHVLIIKENDKHYISQITVYTE